MKKVRYAVIGLGHIAQTAVLPAFKHATKNSELTALISEDQEKLDVLGKKYGVKNLYLEEDFEKCMGSGEVDALYIATPNTDHMRYAVKAAELGIHVLCEKPLATTEEETRAMLHAVTRNDVKFMVAYRLHFDPANLSAIEKAKSGEIGDLRFFNSIFSFQVTDKNNIRLKKDKGGGPLCDIGIYCINASRYLFRSEPVEVFAFSSSNPRDDKFTEVDEMLAVTMRFSDNRLATFTCSFGAADTSRYDLVGTKGTLSLESAYDYAETMKLTVTKDGKDTVKTFAKHDQFAPELIYFADCILSNNNPEPSLLEGLADILVIDAIKASIEEGSPIMVEQIEKVARPSMDQKIVRPGIPKPPEPINATAPSGKN